MEVREEVYVKEQNCSLENEVDNDDAKSFHWVVYASVGTTSSPPPSSNTAATGGAKGDERRVSESTASRVPVGTIRLVPPPHAPHAGAEPPSPSTQATDVDPSRSDSKTPSPNSFREPKEPYIKLGRLSTIAPYRGIGLSKLLYNAAVNWASLHPEDIIPPISPAELEARKLEGKGEPDVWEGLVLAHAQVNVQGLWEKFGFVADKKMGTWVEEGIEHVGMWKRLPVRGVDILKPVQDAFE